MRIRIITDGKIGDLVQCRGVAARLADSADVTETTVSPTGFHALPLPFIPVPKADRSIPREALEADLVLASGRRTLPYLRAIRRQRTGRRPLIVFLKDPRWGRGAADFVWAPKHDRLAGDDVIATHTSPHTLAPDVLAAARDSAAKRFAPCPRPVVGVILGGDSGSVTWDDLSSATFGKALHDLPRRGSVIVTPSRRTPPVLAQAVREALDDRHFWMWDGNGDNPYAEILVHSDRLIVTGDSHNMVSESLASGTPVHVWRPPGLQKKLHAFLDAMEAKGAVHDLAKDMVPFEPVPVDATEEIAAAIRERLG